MNILFIYMSPMDFLSFVIYTAMPCHNFSCENLMIELPYIEFRERCRELMEREG